MSNLLVKGKLSIITGAGSGIGKACCQVMSREGATIIAADQVTKNLTEVVNQLPKLNNNESNHLSIQMDVSSKESVQSALKTILEKYKKPPSCIINCAGITRDNFLQKMSDQDFEDVINVNLKGTYFITKIFTSALIEYGVSNGSVVNLASIVGKYGNIGQSNYCASKAGVELFTKSVSKELAQFGIRCNVVLPGFIKTPMTDLVPDKVKEKFIKQIPLRRFGQPEEIAELITFLASDRSSYINGASIEVTGGL